jgi:hypothetical protein
VCHTWSDTHEHTTSKQPGEPSMMHAPVPAVRGYHTAHAPAHNTACASNTCGHTRVQSPSGRPTRCISLAQGCCPIMPLVPFARTQMSSMDAYHVFTYRGPRIAQQPQSSSGTLPTPLRTLPFDASFVPIPHAAHTPRQARHTPGHTYLYRTLYRTPQNTPTRCIRRSLK